MKSGHRSAKSSMSLEQTLKFSGMTVHTESHGLQYRGRLIESMSTSWTETIPFVSVILADIKLTRSCRLQKNTIAHLKCIKETV